MDILIIWISIPISLARFSEMYYALNGPKPQIIYWTLSEFPVIYGEWYIISASYPVSSDIIQLIHVWPHTLLGGFGDSGTYVP